MLHRVSKHVCRRFHGISEAYGIESTVHSFKSNGPLGRQVITARPYIYIHMGSVLYVSPSRAHFVERPRWNEAGAVAQRQHKAERRPYLVVMTPFVTAPVPEEFIYWSRAPQKWSPPRDGSQWIAQLNPTVHIVSVLYEPMARRWNALKSALGLGPSLLQMRTVIVCSNESSFQCVLVCV